MPTQIHPHTHHRFVQALQHEVLECQQPNCGARMQLVDVSHPKDVVKSFEATCTQCGFKERVTGKEERTPEWEDASLLEMADEHLLHQQPECPFDHTPVVFTSLPNPRRKARYRLSCYYCGRQATMDWPPSESKR